MKNKTIAVLLSMMLAAGAAGVPVYAQEETAAETAEQTAGTEAETTEAADTAETEAAGEGSEAEPADFTLTVEDDMVFTIENKSGLVIQEAVYEAAEEEGEADAVVDMEAVTTEAAETTEAGTAEGEEAETAEAGTTDESTSEESTAAEDTAADGAVIRITEADGTEHIFEGITDTEWTEPSLCEEYGFLYFQYKDASGATQEYAEKADEKELEAETAEYALSNVNVREKADAESTRLGSVSTGDEVTVTAVAPGWLKIKTGDLEGYVSHIYFTTDKAAAEAALKAVQEAEAARKAAEEAAAAEAAAQASYDSYDYSYDSSYDDTSSSETSGGERTVVSTQDYPDCDGSGHGYTEITYSDGTVEYQDY